MGILLYLLLKFVICEEASKKKEKLNLTKEYFKHQGPKMGYLSLKLRT